MKRAFVGQNMPESIHYSLILSDESVINLVLWKSAHFFFIINSIFHLSLRFLRENVDFRLKVSKKLLTRYQVSLSCWGIVKKASCFLLLKTYYTVDTRHRFNAYKTSIRSCDIAQTSYRRWNDVVCQQGSVSLINFCVSWRTHSANAILSY